MSNLFKLLLFTSPVLALIFYYVVSQQSKLDTQMKKDDIQFEQIWNENEAEFAKTPQQRQKYVDRFVRAEEKLKEIEEKEKEKEKKAEEFQKEFEKAIEDFEKRKKGSDYEKMDSTLNSNCKCSNMGWLLGIPSGICRYSAAPSPHNVCNSGYGFVLWLEKNTRFQR